MLVQQALYLLNHLLRPLEGSLLHPALYRCCGGWAGEKLEWWGTHEARMSGRGRSSPGLCSGGGRRQVAL